MDKQLLIKNIKNLTKIHYDTPWDERGTSNLEAIQSLIEEYLEKHPQDSEVWLRLVMLEFTSPWEDPDLMIQYLHEILVYDPDHIYANLILAYTHYLFFAEVPDDLFEKLNNLSSNDPEINSMIELLKAYYYKCKNNDCLYEKHLLRSINYCSKHVKNYKNLAYFYTEKGKKNKARECAQKALDNVTVIFDINSPITDMTDVEEFIDEFLKGTLATNVDSIYELLK